MKVRKRIRFEKWVDDSGVVNSNIYYFTKFEDNFYDYLFLKYCSGIRFVDIIKENGIDISV